MTDDQPGTIASLLQQAVHIFETMEIPDLSAQWRDKFIAEAQAALRAAPQE